MNRHYQTVRWTHTDAGDYDGVGEHASYKVHKLSHLETGVPGKLPVLKTRSWMTARKLGVNPFKIVGGPYKTAKEAMSRAEGLEASL